MTVVRLAWNLDSPTPWNLVCARAILLRARYNGHRHYEVYMVTCGVDGRGDPIDTKSWNRALIAAKQLIQQRAKENNNYET